eukprot:355129-Chlamydomonas_euryale.AAC.3
MRMPHSRVCVRLHSPLRIHACPHQRLPACSQFVHVWELVSSTLLVCQLARRAGTQAYPHAHCNDWWYLEQDHRLSTMHARTSSCGDILPVARMQSTASHHPGVLFPTWLPSAAAPRPPGAYESMYEDGMRACQNRISAGEQC